MIEFCRSVLGWEDANSTEFDEATANPAVVFMPEISTTHLGGTMRLGSRRTIFQTERSVLRELYGGAESIDERHRHRYEVNPDAVGVIEEAGMRFTGKDESGRRCQVMELDDHPYFVATQFHPEFKSRPGQPEPSIRWPHSGVDSVLILTISEHPEQPRGSIPLEDLLIPPGCELSIEVRITRVDAESIDGHQLRWRRQAEDGIQPRRVGPLVRSGDSHVR